MNTPDAMRALAGGTTTAVSAPMKDRGTVTVTRRHGDSCPFTVTNDSGDLKRTYKFRKIATAFQRARANTSVDVEWSASAYMDNLSFATPTYQAIRQQISLSSFRVVPLRSRYSWANQVDMKGIVSIGAHKQFAGIRG